jgi:hypothetical protein
MNNIRQEIYASENERILCFAQKENVQIVIDINDFFKCCVNKY